MMTGLILFPCCAVLWVFICDHLGLVRDEPLIKYSDTL
jgi:hypothetical protein